MTKVQKTVAQWVQRIVGKAEAEAEAEKLVPTARRPAELDAQSLRHVSGGNGETPVKGW